MSQPQSQGKRIRSGIVKSRSSLNGSELSGGVNENLIGESGNIFFSTEQHIPSKLNDTAIKLNTTESCVLSEKTPLVESETATLGGIENVKLTNGFKLQPYAHLRKYRSLPSMSGQGDYNAAVNSRASGSRSGNPSKIKEKRKIAKASKYKIFNHPLDLPEHTSTFDGGSNITHSEESIIEGFSIMAFGSCEEMELYARLMTKKSPEKKSSVPSALARRPRRSAKSSTTTKTKNNALGPVDELVEMPDNCGDMDPLDAKSVNGRPLLTIGAKPQSSPSVPVANGIKVSPTTTSDMSVSPIGTFLKHEVDKIDVSDSGTAAAPKSAVTVKLEAGATTPEHMAFGDLKTNSVKSETLSSVPPKAPSTTPASSIVGSTASSSAAANTRYRFSIAALTACETTTPSTLLQPQPLQQPNPPLALSTTTTTVTTNNTITSKPAFAVNGNGRLLPPPQQRTPAQWLERLTTPGGGSACSQREIRHLAHLLLTDHSFAEQVSRLPCVEHVFPQIAALFYQQASSPSSLPQLHHHHQHLMMMMPMMAQQASFDARFLSMAAGPTTAGTASLQQSLSKPFPGSQYLPQPSALQPPLLTSTPASFKHSRTSMSGRAKLDPQPTHTTFTCHPAFMGAGVGTPYHPQPPPLIPSPAAAIRNPASMATAASNFSAGIRPEFAYSFYCPIPTSPTGASSSLQRPSLVHPPSGTMHPHFFPQSNASETIATASTTHNPANMMTSLVPTSTPGPNTEAPSFWGHHIHNHPHQQNLLLSSGAMPPNLAFAASVAAAMSHGMTSSGSRKPILPTSPTFLNAMDLTFSTHHQVASKRTFLSPTSFTGRHPAVTSTAFPRPPLPPQPQKSQNNHHVHHNHYHRRPHVPTAAVHRGGVNVVPPFRDLFRCEGVASCNGATAPQRICLHIISGQTHGLKRTIPSDPWWYVTSNRDFPQPRPRDSLPMTSTLRPPLPPPPHSLLHPALSPVRPAAPFTFEHLMRPPIAIDLTKPISTHTGSFAHAVPPPSYLKKQTVSTSSDSLRHTPERLASNQLQEKVLATTLKRRRITNEATAIPSQPGDAVVSTSPILASPVVTVPTLVPINHQSDARVPLPSFPPP